MKKLQIKQKLRALAHQLKPVVIIGRQGLTESVQLEIERALLAHELIKIRISGKTPKEQKEIIDAICQERSAELIQTIGHVIVIYRQNEEEK